MLRAFKLASLAAVAALGATTAHAAVTFDWISTTGGIPTPTAGQITITDAAFAAGSWSVHLTRGGTPEANAPFFAASPVLSAFLTNLGPSFTTADMGAFHCSDCIYDFNMSTVQGGQYLTGSLSMSDGFGNIRASGTATSWVYSVDRDAPPCMGPAGCQNTGFWQREETPSPTPSVPEPASAALLLAGIGAVFAHRVSSTRR